MRIFGLSLNMGASEADAGSYRGNQIPTQEGFAGIRLSVLGKTFNLAFQVVTTLWILINSMVAVGMFYIGYLLCSWGLNFSDTSPSLMAYANWLFTEDRDGLMQPAMMQLAGQPAYWTAIGHTMVGSLAVIISSPIILTSLEGAWFVVGGIFSVWARRIAKQNVPNEL